MTNLKANGFTLVEALVALVILSTTFTAVWSWVGNVVTNTASIESALNSPVLLKQIDQHLALADLSTTSKGSFTIEHLDISWQAEKLEDSDGAKFRTNANFKSALFALRIKVYDAEKLINEFEVLRYYEWARPNRAAFLELD